MKRRIIAFIMAMVLWAIPQMVWATDIEGNVITPRWTYVHSISAALTVNGFVAGDVELEDYHDFLLILQLQEKDGSSWTTIETWSIEGNFSGAIEEYYDLDPDLDYRAKVTAKVFTDLGRLVETVSIYSRTV